MLKENIIIGYFEILNNNSEEIIINSYENVKREKMFWKLDRIQSIENEEEIKNCEIYINEKKTNFNYHYIFEDKGKYTIKYKFKELLKSTNFMFFGCISLISLDLSNFNTQNLENVDFMFSCCNSIKSLELSKFNTQKVINMGYIFSG